MIGAQGGNPQVLDRFELLPNATGAREIASPRAGYVSAIDAEYIGLASAMIGAGRDTKEDSIDPAVGVILEVKIGQKVDAGGVLCRLYYTSEDHVEEAAQLVEDAFRISSTAPEERALILKWSAEARSGSLRPGGGRFHATHGAIHRPAGSGRRPGSGVSVLAQPQRRSSRA